MIEVFAIDPGSSSSALVVLDVGGQHVRLVRAERSPNEKLLLMLHGAVSLAERLMAVEVPRARGMPASNELFETCVWAGRFIEALGVEHHYVDRHQVKLTVCGDARAKDPNIRAALIDRWGGSKAAAVGTKKSPGPLYGFKSDMWAALAVAETFIERELGITEPVRAGGYDDVEAL